MGVLAVSSDWGKLKGLGWPQKPTKRPLKPHHNLCIQVDMSTDYNDALADEFIYIVMIPTVWGIMS